MSEKRGSGMRKEQPAPCFRCLFDKPINDGWCDPAKCEMLGFWLTDEDYSWSKYYLGWIMRLEQENSIKNGLTENI